MTALLFAWLWAAVDPVTVVGAAACPMAADVEARVAALLPTEQASDAPDLARLEETDGALRVTLQRPDGTLIGERALDRSFSCSDLAAAAAVIVASWESDVHAEFRPAPARPPAPVEAPRTTEIVARAPAPPSYDLGAALLGLAAPRGDTAGLALGALVVGSWTPARHDLGARLAIAGTTARDLALGSGHVDWTRVGAAAGPQLTFASASSPWQLQLHGDALLAWLSVGGGGFVSDRNATSVDPGLGAGARVLRRRGRVVPWIELAGEGWLRSQTAYATPSGASATLPRLEAIVALGLSFCAGP